MLIREKLDGLILPALRLLAPGAERGDIKYFSGFADVSSPLPAKYGIDIDAPTVYNILKQTALEGVPLFLRASAEGGFLNLYLTDEAIEKLAEISCELGGSLEPAAEIEVGTNPASVHARLSAIAHSSEDGAFTLTGIGRRAFLRILTASTEASLNIALAETEGALWAHRRALVKGERSMLIPGRAARAMALALSRLSENTTIE